MAEVVEEITDWIESPDTPAVSPEPAAPAATPAAPSQSPAAETGPPSTAAGPDDDEDSGETEHVRDPRTGRWQTKAKKDKAGPRIMKLANELRQTREELAAVKARVTPPPQAPSVPQHVFQVPQVPSGAFTEPEPQLKDFASDNPDADPYGDWLLARAEWRMRKGQAESVRGHQQQHVERLSHDQQQFWNTVQVTHAQRLMQTVAQRPEFVPLLQRVAPYLPPGSLLDRAIMLDNDSVSAALFLASRPDVLDELVLMTAAQPVTQQTVATTQRLLRQRMTAVGSGAAAPSPALTPAPRPPTPLRTAPMTIGETVPGDDDSLEAHEAHFHRQPRHHRR